VALFLQGLEMQKLIMVEQIGSVKPGGQLHWKEPILSWQVAPF